MTSLLELLAACTGFDWDQANAEKNRIRHQVGPGECEETFFNEPILVAVDENYSQRGPRYYALGDTDGRRGLFLAFTVRGQWVRVISARYMSRRERKEYIRGKEEANPSVPKRGARARVLGESRFGLLR